MIVMAEKPRRQCRVERRPLCPEHGDTMYAGSSPRLIAYYYCSAPGCKHSDKARRVYNDVKESPQKPS